MSFFLNTTCYSITLNISEEKHNTYLLSTLLDRTCALRTSLTKRAFGFRQHLAWVSLAHWRYDGHYEKDCYADLNITN